MKIYFDMPNVIKRGMFVGKDQEGPGAVPDPKDPEKTVWVNGAGYTHENVINLMLTAIRNHGCTPKDVVMVWEGNMPTILRKHKVPKGEYKASRGERPREVYVELKKAQETITKFWLDLGATSVVQDAVEADDILAYFAQNTEESCLIWSHDGDMVRLMGTNEYGAKISVGNNDTLNVNPYGPFDTRFVTVYKALVGDIRDNIKGAPGFGEKSFFDVLRIFGEEGLETIEELIRTQTLDRLQEDVEHCKALKKIINNEQAVYDSYKLASLYPEAIDTLNSPLRWTHGMVRDLRPGDDSRFQHWYGKRTLVHRANFESVLRAAAAINSPIVSLDLETTVPEEAEIWLEEKKKRDSDSGGVDVFGSEIVSCGITLGDNFQHTYYFTHRHAPEPGIEQLSIEQMERAIRTLTQGRRVLIHNAGGFELPVLLRHFGEAWESEDNPAGMLENAICTQLMACYINENLKSNLKFSSKHYLDYDQETYEHVTTLSGPPGTLPPGGRLKSLTEEVEAVEGVEEQEATSEMRDGILVVTPALAAVTAVDAVPATETRQYKMDELTATHVFNYGTDDTIVTSALYNAWKHRLQLEHSWKVYKMVELDAMYLVAYSFVQGVRMDLEKLQELESIDDKVHDDAWATLRTYLMKQGWPGTVPPTYTAEIDAAQIKEAYEIFTGSPLVTKVRTPSKLVKLIEAEGEDLFASTLQDLLNSKNGDSFTRLVRSRFKGEPEINFDSPIQMSKLLYETMGLPVEVRNKPTDKARARGETVGTPKSDELAVKYAMRHATEEQRAALAALGEIKMVATRRKLYYKPYKLVGHWEDGRVHPSIRQSSTNTRRFSGSDPNPMQVAKNEKVTGEKPRIREVYLPHKEGAVIVAPDFEAQELRHIAEQSQDENMLACFDPRSPKDMHAMTGVGILNNQPQFSTLTYEGFMEILKSKDHPQKQEIVNARALGKKTNFTTEFGAQKTKLAQTLLVSEDEAQAYIDAKTAAFPGVVKWKDAVIAEAHRTGLSRTMLGAVRHLRAALTSDDRWESSKAERQAINFRIQSSSAEQTKLAMGRMWRERLFLRYDAQFYFPVHDELVTSVMADQAIPFTKELHSMMCQPYATMRVPVSSSVGIGWNFGELVEVGSVMSDEALQAALDRLRETVAA